MKNKLLDSNDRKHIMWLIREMFKSLLKGEILEAIYCIYWIKFHLKHESTYYADKNI